MAEFTKEQLPSWMTQEEQYSPEADKDGFITKSFLKVMSLLGEIRENVILETTGAGAAMKLIYTLVFILLAALSRNMLFTYILLAGLLVRMVLLPERQLVRVFKGAIGVTGLSLLLLLPAVFLGSPQSMLTVSLKVFLSVGLINLMAVTTPWNQITEALKVFYVPDMFIFVFDITLKYIAILGDLCFNVLTSLRLRSVGKNHHKGNSLSGVLGVTFLKSREMSEEMYGAMVCRGFEGEYHKRKKNPFIRRDFLYLLLIAAVAALFIYLR